MRRWYRDHRDAEVYIAGIVCGLKPAAAEDLLRRLPLPLAHSGRQKLTAWRQARQQGQSDSKETSARSEAKAAAQKRAERARLAKIAEALTAADDDGRIRILAGLSPADRDALGSPKERRAAIALRKAGLMTSAVMTRLDCTRTELNRWDSDGRLPHLYTRRLPLPKSTECRFWAEADIDRARELIADWRHRDSIVKTHRRRGLRIVA